MVPLQEKAERFIGEKFIEWMNSNKRSRFVFSCRGNLAPDLIFTDGDEELGVEISSAYYDGAYAKLVWEGSRGKKDAPSSWGGVNFEDTLVANINKTISMKAAKQYGSNCVLVIYVDPRLTEHQEMRKLAARVEMPIRHSFRGIYILGYFPPSYDIIPLYPI